jgi:hypothetical protein
MITGDLDNQMKQVFIEIDSCNKECERLKLCSETFRTPQNIVEEYNELILKKDNYIIKKRKEMEKEIQKIKNEFKYIEQDQLTLQKYLLKTTELSELQSRYESLNNHVNSDVNRVLSLLRNDGFIEDVISQEEESEKLEKLEKLEKSEKLEHLTLKGKIASQLREVHCLVFANLLEDKKLEAMTSRQLVSFFSCFTNISVQEGIQDFTPNTSDYAVEEQIHIINKLYSEYEDKETNLRINTGSDYNIHYDLINYVLDWCDSESIEDCKWILQKLAEEKEIFLGEFVKALLKINNISSEMEKIAEMTGNIAFLSKLREIPNLTLKYVVTNQSLYV